METKLRELIRMFEAFRRETKTAQWQPTEFKRPVGTIDLEDGTKAQVQIVIVTDPQKFM